MKCPFCIKVCKKCKDRIGEARILVAYTGNFTKKNLGNMGFEVNAKHAIENTIENTTKPIKNTSENTTKNTAKLIKNTSENAIENTTIF